MALEGLYAQIGQAPGQLNDALMRNKLLNANIASQQGGDARAEAMLGMEQQKFGMEQEQAAAQAARQQQYNALLSQYLGPEQGAIAAQVSQAPAAPQQNALLSQLYQMDPARTTQLLQFQQQQQAAAQKQQQEEAQQIVRAGQFILESRAPKSLLKTAFPDLVSGLKDHGVNVDDMNDDQVRELATQTIAQYGPVAGIGPVKRETPDQFAKINPGDYTPESVAKFQQTANFADLRKAQPVATADPNQGFTRANVLRDEFNAANKDFFTIQAQYGNILATSRQPSAAGDISLITSYMKMLDPQSTVREGEFANAENAGGIPSKIRALNNKLINGERLAPEQRADFVKQSAALFAERQKQANRNRERYALLARRAGVDPLDVVGSTENEMEPTEVPVVQQAPPSAVEYLRKNPALRADFKAKYGYLPEGM